MVGSIQKGCSMMQNSSLLCTRTECLCSSLLLVSPWTREKEKLKVKAVYQTTARLRALLLYRTGTRTLLVRVALQSTIVLHLTSPRGIFVSGTVHISRLSEPVI